MDLSYFDGIGNLFLNILIVMVYDDIIWDWLYIDGNDFVVIITVWQEVLDTQIVLGDDGVGGIWVNFIVDVVVDYGIHQGILQNS